jgi:hypothetical protein
MANYKPPTFAREADRSLRDDEEKAVALALVQHPSFKEHHLFHWRVFSNGVEYIAHSWRGKNPQIPPMGYDDWRVKGRVLDLRDEGTVGVLLYWLGPDGVPKDLVFDFHSGKLGMTLAKALLAKWS